MNSEEIHLEEDKETLRHLNSFANCVQHKAQLKVWENQVLKMRCKICIINDARRTMTLKAWKIIQNIKLGACYSTCMQYLETRAVQS